MRVHFYATLRAAVGEKTVVLPLAEGTSVQELALEIARHWPELAEQLIDVDGEVSRQVHFMIDGRNMRWLPDRSATKLYAENVIDVFPPTAGG